MSDDWHKGLWPKHGRIVDLPFEPQTDQLPWRQYGERIYRGDRVEVRGFSAGWREAIVESVFFEGVHMQFLKSDSEIEEEDGRVLTKRSGGGIYMPFGSEDWRKIRVY